MEELAARFVVVGCDLGGRTTLPELADVPVLGRQRRHLGDGLALGERRAAAVRNYLIASGVPPQQLQIVSWGRDERPIGPSQILSREDCPGKQPSSRVNPR